jgi:hypothetical protein
MEETVFNLQVTVFSKFLSFLCSSAQIAGQLVNAGYILSFVKYADQRQLHL